MAGIRRKGLGDDQESIGEGANTPLRLALDSARELVALEMRSAGDVERTSAGNNAPVDDGVVDTPQAITDGIGDLGDSVLVGTLDEEGHGLGILHLLDEGVLLLAQRLLVHKTSPAEHVGGEILAAVLRRAAAYELETLHIPPLRPPQSHDAVLREDIERKRVDALLVDDNEVLLRVAPAHLLLQVNDPLELLIHEATLALHELIALLSARVEEARVDLGLLVLQADVKRKDIRVLHPLGHIRVPRAVVEREAADELGIGSRPMLHLHDLDHVKVGLRGGLVDGQNGVDDVRSELRCESAVELGGKSGSRDVEEELSVNVLSDGEILEELYRQLADKPSRYTLVHSRPTLIVSFFAISKPSVMMRGCSPSVMCLSACFSSSPTRRTTDVVPSPQMSSCAVAARAIMTAVGFLICISRRRTFPSFVSLI